MAEGMRGVIYRTQNGTLKKYIPVAAAINTMSLYRTNSGAMRKPPPTNGVEGAGENGAG